MRKSHGYAAYNPQTPLRTYHFERREPRCSKTFCWKSSIVASVTATCTKPASTGLLSIWQL